jgi:cobalamin biosynthesis protein CobD/CbiB
VNELTTMGNGRAALDAADMDRALELYGVMLNLALTVCAAIAVLAWW